MTTMSAREFNHDVSAAKRAAADHPVVITDRGRPTHVLLSIDQYERLARVPITGVGSFLADASSAEFELPLPCREVELREIEL